MPRAWPAPPAPRSAPAAGSSRMRDLTDTLETRVQQRTQALAETEERFRATFEGFPEPLFVVRVARRRPLPLRGL